MKITGLTTILSAGLIIALSLSGCFAAPPGNTENADKESRQNTFTFKKDPVTVSDFKLDTFIAISVYEDVDESLLKDTLALCDRYENMLSMHKEGGDLYRLNANVTNRVPSELGRLLEASLEWSGKSEGCFQISIGRVSRLWDFTSGSHALPSDKNLSDALSSVDDSSIRVYREDETNNNSDYIVEKPAGVVLDLGAVAKGYIADRLKEDLLSKGIRSAVINLGGNVLCVGDKNGEPFNIGIRKPFAGESDMITVLGLKDLSGVSSGISERYFEKDGHIYHHILDPKTGYPYENELYQCTVISKDSLTGDLMSTICYCLGPEKALKLCEETPDTEIILVKDDYELIKSSGADKYIK